MSLSTFFFFFFILQVLVAFVVNQGRAPNCEKEKQKCETQYAYLKTHYLFSVATEQELQTFCNSTEEFVDCMTKYFQECGDPDAKLEKKVTVLMRPLMNTICTPENTFIRRFLEFTACYAKVAIEYDLCVHNYAQEIERLSKLSSASVTSEEQKICCYFENFLHCTRSVVQNKCSKGVADTGEEISRILMHKEIRSSCTVYSYDSPYCSFIHTATVPSAFPEEKPDECQLSQWCTAVFLYWESHDIFDVVTEAQLTNICTSATDSKTCAEEHIRKCGTTPEISTTMRIISLVQGLIDAVCKPGDQIRQRYLIFTNSYPNFAAELEICREQFSKNRKISMQMEMPEFNRRAKRCCDYESANHCRRTAIESKSGKAVVDIAMEVYGILGYKSVESSCSVFGNNNPECPSSYSSSVNNANLSTVTHLMTTTSATSSSTTTSATSPSTTTSATSPSTTTATSTPSTSTTTATSATSPLTTTATSTPSTSTTTATSATSASTTKHVVNNLLPLLCILVLFRTSMF